MHNASRSASIAGTFGLVQMLTALPVTAADLSAGPGDDLVAIVGRMQDGDRLTLMAGHYAGGLLVSGRSISIVGPETGEAVIDPPVGTNVLLGAVDGAAVHVERLSFAPDASAPLALFVQAASARCTACRFQNTPDAPVYAEGSTLELVGGLIADVAGNGVVALAGSSLSIRDMRIQGVSGSAIISQDAAATSLTGLDVSGGGGILVTGEGALDIRQSKIVTITQGAALQVQTSGESRIEASRFEALQTGLQAYLGGAATFSITGTTALGGTGALYAESRDGASPSLDIRDSRFISTGNRSAVGLVGGASTALTDNLMLSPDIGVYLGEGSDATLNGNTIIGPAVGIGVPEGADGTVHRLDDNFIVSDLPIAGQLDPGRATARISAALAAEPATEQALRADLVAATSGEAPAEAEVLARIEAAVAAVRTAARRFGTLRMVVADAAGREELSGFAILDDVGMIITESVDGGIVAAPAGPKRIAPLFDLGLAQPLELAEGQDVTVSLDLPRSLWVPLPNVGDTSPRLRLFRALPSQMSRKLLQANGYDWRLEAARAFPRADAGPGEIVGALKLARDAVAALAEVPVPLPQDSWQNTAQARLEARRILAVHGDPEDVRLLLDGVLPHPDDIQSGTIAAAFLEAKLGKLRRGAVLAQMRSDDQARAYAAALALRLFGSTAARDQLLDWIGDAAVPNRPQMVYLLRQIEDARVTDTYRASLENFIAAPRGGDRVWFPTDILPHLIAYGQDHDWRRLGVALALLEDHSMAGVAEILAAYAVDPLEFTERLASNIAEDSSLPQKRLCPLLRVRGPEPFHRLNAALQSQSSAWWQQIRNSRNTYNQYFLEVGGCWPNESAARYYHTGETQLKGRYFALPYMPEVWHEDELVQLETTSSVSEAYFDLVDFLPPDELAAAYQAAAGPPLPNPELRHAYRRVVTRAGYDQSVHSYEDGLERRSFVLRHVDTEDYSGAISGMVTVDPQLDDAGDLVIRLRIDTVPYYHGCCDLASTIANNNDLSAWLHAPYLVDGASALIKSVTLTHNGIAIPVTMTGPHALGFRVTAGAVPDRLAGLVLTVELELFGDRRSLVFDLYAGGKARGFGGASPG